LFVLNTAFAMPILDTVGSGSMCSTGGDFHLGVPPVSTVLSGQMCSAGGDFHLGVPPVSTVLSVQMCSAGGDFHLGVPPVSTVLSVSTQVTLHCDSRTFDDTHLVHALITLQDS
jgi:hypothetical protein